MSQQPAQATEAPTQPTALTVAEPSKGPVQLQVGQKGFSLNTLDEAWRFCTAMAASGLMPKGMDTAQKILFALQKGFEVGLPPLAAVQSIAVINGRASLYGDVVLGIVINSGKFDIETFEEDWIRAEGGSEVIGAYCVVRRLPNGKPKRWDFTKEDAMKAKLWGKEGPWSTSPKRMMQMRARAFALRDIFPDILSGITTVEEAMDLPAEKNITPTTARPTTLDELTDKLGSEPAAAVTAETAPQAEPAAETASTEPATASEGDSGPYAAIKAQLEECRTVPDVTRLRNSFTGPASKLSDQEKADVNAICESRADAIRAAKKANTQQSLV